MLAERGELCIAWPEEWGGRGASQWEQTAVREEMWAHWEPRGAQYMGVNWVGPTIMRHGTPEQQRQHLPAIAGTQAFSLAATVSPHDPGPEGVPHLASLEELLEKGPAIDAVALCTPPQVRYGLAVQALKRGIHVFLEKPPGATLSEVVALRERADKVGVTLFASWHSRFAAGVAPARAWLAERKIEKVSIVWREDVRVWHPGQAWIWEPGGLGVFDPGINALSILTHILPRPVFLKAATLSLPENRADRG